MGSNEQTNPDVDPDAGSPEVTTEVGSEGGSPGEVEIGRSQHGTGTEAGETWRPADRRTTRVVRDQTGRGRRSP